MFKLNFLFTGAFWGGLLILVGISAILKSFNIHIPLFRIAVGVLVIYIGLAFLVGTPFEYNHHNVLFRNMNITITDTVNHEYNIVFGSGTIDLTDLDPESVRDDVEINTVFGSGVVKVNSEIPIKMTVNSAFASTRMPDGHTLTFGNYTYPPQNYEGDTRPIEIEVNSVFSSLEIEDVNL